MGQEQNEFKINYDNRVDWHDVFNALAEDSSDGVFLVDITGKIAEENRAFCAMFGYEESCPPGIRLEAVNLGVALSAQSGLAASSAPVQIQFRKCNDELVEKAVVFKQLSGGQWLGLIKPEKPDFNQLAQAWEQHRLALMALYQTSLEINAQVDPSALLDAIIERAARLVGAPVGAIYLVEPGGDLIKLVACYNLPERYLGFILQVGEGVSGKVAQTGENLMIADYQAWQGQVEAYRPMAFRRLLGVPLKIEDQVIGVINIADSDQIGSYSDQDIQLINLFANQAALAIHNARLLETAKHELAERTRVEEKLIEANHNLERQLNFTETLLKSIPTPIFYKDSTGHYQGCNPAFTRHTGLTQEDILGKTAFDIWPEKYAGFYTQKDRDLFELRVPQAYEYKIINSNKADRDAVFVKDVYYDDKGAIAGILGAYMDITEFKHAEIVQAALYRISEAAQISHDLDGLYREIHAIIRDLLPADNFYIARYDADADLITFPYFVDENEPTPPARKPGRGLTEFVIQSGQPLLALPGLADSMEVSGQVDRIGPLSIDWLGVPLKSYQTVIGVMAVQTYSPSVRYTIADQEMLTFVSEQVAMAIERKQAENALHETNKTLQALIQVSPLGIVLTDTDGKVKLWNPAAEKIYGWQESEVIGKFQPQIPENKHSEFNRIKKITTQGGVITNFEVHRIRKDGQPIDISLSVAPLNNPDGEVTSLIGFNLDITDHKRTEMLLESLNNAALALQRSTSTAMIFKSVGREVMKIGLTCTILTANEKSHSLDYVYSNYTEKIIRSAEKITGLKSLNFSVPASISGPFSQVLSTRQTLFQESIGDIVPMTLPPHLQYLSGSLTSLFGDRHVIIAPLLVEDDLTGLFIVKSNDLHEADVPAVTAFANQIAAAWQRARLFEEIRRLNDDLEKRVEERTASLLAAIKELEAFSYTISHDLRAPLRAIDGFTNILVENYQGNLDPEGVRICRVLRSEVERMSHRIDDVLMLAKLNRMELHPTEIDMAGMVNLVLEELTILENHDRIDLVVKSIPVSWGDPKLIRQVWAHLLSNALKFSAKKEKAVIEMGSQPGEEEIIYYVKDNGVGFNMLYSDKLFGVFQRLHTDREFPGSGVGLAMTKRIIERHGGRIWADSRPGQGAVFYFTLPKRTKII